MQAAQILGLFWKSIMYLLSLALPTPGADDLRARQEGLDTGALSTVRPWCVPEPDGRFSFT